MTGTIYLGCGSADDEAELWNLMLHRPVTRIVYWPFALPEAILAGADQWLRANLNRLDVAYELNTWTSLDGHSPLELEDVDLLFVGGGNPFQLLHQVRREGFIDPVRAFVHAGGDYYGGSAGAVLACSDINIANGHDPNTIGLVDLTALGLISDAAVLPHFTAEQVDDSKRWVAASGRTLIGLPENAGLRTNQSRFEVVGTGSVHVIALTSTHLALPGSTFEIA